jgi:uncharacterized membrane protein (Fun14 family)
MMNEGSVSQEGLVETLKNAMQPDAIADKLGMDKHTLFDIGLYGAIGFITGFLLKKYSEYFIALLLVVIGVVVLQQFDYISIAINMPKVNEAFGLQSMPVAGDKYGTLLLEWIKSNIAGSASLVVGFLIGLKVG